MRKTREQYENIIQNTKKDIVDVARWLFSEYSYLGVSMADIAKKINITKAALYYHFTGKAEIYKKVLDEVFDDLNLSITEALNETTINKKLHKFIKGYLNFGFKEKNLIKALVLKLSPADPQIRKYITQLRKRIIGLIQPVIEEVSVNKKTTQEADSRLLASLLISMMDGLILKCSFLNKKINSEKTTKQIIATLF